MSEAAAREALLREQLARLATNPRFASAPKLRAFLEFIVERTLAGKAREIKEYTVALAVYGRREDYDPKTDSIVRVEAGRLRARLKEYFEQEGAQDPVVIELPKGSYVPAFTIRSAEAAPAEPAPAPEAAITGRRWRWWAGGAALAAAVAVAAVLLIPRSGPGAAPPTITITPFHNLSLDRANDALTNELSKSVEVELTRSGRLKVIGSGTSDLSLDASVRRRDGRLLVMVQLLDRRDGAYIWSDSFERESAEAAPSMTDTARRIASDVEVQAILAVRRAEGGSPRGRAQELYRMGRAQLRPKDDGFLLRGHESYERPSLEAVTRAIGYLEQSVAMDPTYAAGWSTLATYYQMAGDIDPRLLEKAVRSARKAIEIDPNLGDAHATLGYIDFLYSWKFPEAAEEFRIALEREPRRPAIHRLYSDCLILLGRNEEAAADLRRALILYPNHPTVETARVMLFYQAGPAAETEPAARRLAASLPEYPLAHWTLGLALEQGGDYPGAIREFEECLKHSPGDGRCVPALGHAYGLAGRTADAERMLAAIRNRSATQTRGPYEMALIQTALGRDDAAIANLQSAFDQRELGFPYLKVEPRFARLRQRSEVRALLAKIGL